MQTVRNSINLNNSGLYKKHKTYDNFFPAQPKEKILTKKSYIKTKKNNFFYFMSLENYNEGLVETIFEILCIKNSWKKDLEIKKCENCKKEFNFLLRKHHCRCCGLIFCSECSKYSLKIKCDFFDKELISTFEDNFNCVYNKKLNELILRICLECFSENLDDFVGDANYFTNVPKLKKSFKNPDYNNFKIKFEIKKTNLINNSLFKKTTHDISNFLYNLLIKEIPDCYIDIEFLDNFMKNLFIHFEYLTQHKIDFNHMDLKNIIEITRIHNKEELSIDFYNGIILKINSNNYFKNSRKINFPTFLIIKKNYCISHCDEKGNFKYLNLNEIQKTMEKNENYLKNLIENDTKKIDIVFSEFPLPTHIFFLLKKKKIEFIFPVKREKLNLIERYIRGSNLWLQMEKYNKTTNLEKEVLLTGFAGKIKIMRINFKNNNSYRVFLQKKSEKHSFNTFSIAIKGPLDLTTKRLKENLKKFLPIIFHKYLEVHLINYEINSLKIKEIKKMEDQNKLNTVSLLNLEKLSLYFNLNEKSKLVEILSSDKSLTYYETLVSVQNPLNTYKEYSEDFRKFIDNKESFLIILKKINYNFKEFHALEELYEYENYSYLGNLNLSKNNKMVKGCNFPIKNVAKIYGLNDSTIYKTIQQLFKNNEIRCLSCSSKFKHHSRVFYINKCAIKMDTYKIKILGKNYIYPMKSDRNEFDFKNFKKPLEKFYRDRNLGFNDKIRTGILCLDCNKLLSELFYLTEIFQCLSFTYFLFSFSCDNSNEKKCLEKSKGILKNNNIEKLSKNHSSTFSMKNINHLTEEIKNTQNYNSIKFLSPLIRNKNKKRYDPICFHNNICRIFIKNDSMQCFSKKKVNVFRLLINSEVKSGNVDNKKRLESLKNFSDNFNFLIDYLLFVLSSLEKLFFSENVDYLKKNIRLILDVSQQLKNLKISKKFEIGEKSQKLSNDSYFENLNFIKDKIIEFEYFANTEISLENEKIKISDIENLLKNFPLLLIKKENKIETVTNVIEKSMDLGNESVCNINEELEGRKSFISESSKIISSLNHLENNNDTFFLNVKMLQNFRKKTNLIVLEENSIFYYKSPLSYYANYLNKKYNNKEQFDSIIKNNEQECNIDLNKNLNILNFKIDEELKDKFYDMIKDNKIELINLFKEYFKLNISYPCPKIKINLIEYFGQKFQELRKLYRINLEYFFHSISEIKNFNPSGGKTDADFFMTHDKKYIAKEINSTEFKSFLKFCPDYITYLTEIHNSNRKSLLCLIFALFKVNKKCYIIMENLNFFIKDDTNIMKTYDLKGSELNRLIFKIKKNQTLPDTNFQIERNGDPIYFESKKIKNLLEILKRDTFFLSKKELIDYSLLLVLDVDNKLAFMKIIDYLREYDFSKNIENKWKKMRSNANPTIVETNKYRDRFLNSAEKYFILIN